MSVSLPPSARFVGLAVLCLGLLVGCGEESNPRPLGPRPLMPDAARSTVSLSPGRELQPDGEDRGHITVTVLGDDGAPMMGRTVTVAVSGEGNTVAQAQEKTDARGVATASVVSTRSGAKRVTASVSAEGGAVVLASQPSFTFAAQRATQLLFTGMVRDATAGSVLSGLEVRFADESRRTVTGAGEQVVLSLVAGPGQAVLEGTLMAMPVDGVARFPEVVVKKAGAGFQLRATAAGVTDALTAAFTVAPGAAASLEITGLESNAVAGAPRSARVTVRDAFSNVATNYTGTLALSASDVMATLPTSHVFTAGDAGDFTFTGITLKRAGRHEVIVQDPSRPTLNARRSVGVLAGEAAVLSMARLPVSASVATVLPSLSVTLEDAFGNVAPVGSPRVALSLVESGTLSGVREVAPVDGVASFTQVRVDSEGEFHLRATATGLAAVNSSTAITIVDDVPPSRPVLSLGTLGANSAQVNWVAVGDDGDLGTATSQELRYSLQPILTVADFNAATPVNVSAPQPAGTAESAQLSSLVPDRTYYVALRVTDNRGNFALSASLMLQTVNNDVRELRFDPLPASGTAGAVFGTVRVSLRNAAGQVVDSATTPVTLSLEGGHGFVPIQVSAVAGVATFENVRVDRAGTHRFVATGNALTQPSATFVINAAAVARLAVTGLVGPVVAGQSQILDVSAQDAFGNLVRGYLGTVTFTSNDPQATLPANYTFVSGDAGHQVFPGVKLVTAGTRRVTVTDTVNAQLTGFVEAEVTSGAVNRLVLSGLPANVAAGSTHALTLQVQDSFGNRVTGYTGEVLFASDDPQAVLSVPSHVFTLADAGQYSFQATLKSSGARAVTATEARSGGLTVALGTQVAPGPAVALSVQLSSTSPTAGQAVTATVTLGDVFGNRASGYRGTLNLQVNNDPGATGLGDYTFTAVDAGQHVFNVMFTRAQSTVLTATDTQQPTLTGAESVSVGEGPLFALSVAPVAGPVTAGEPQSFLVSARDCYDNLVRSYAGTVTPTTTDARAVVPSAHTYGAGDQGAHSFSFTLKTAGAQTVTFTAGALNVSAPVTVVPGPVNKLSFVDNALTGFVRQTLAPVRVVVEDAFGNRVTVNPPAVTLTLYGGGVLSGTTTLTPVAGVAEFTTLSVAEEGAHVLNATVTLPDVSIASVALNITDNQAPSDVASLEATVLGGGVVRLRWLATGDDGMQGQATSYELRYSESPITEANLPSATSVPTGTPGLPGAQEQVDVPNLVEGQTYHFAVRVMDSAGNTSALTKTSVRLPSVCDNHVCAPQAATCSASGVERVTYAATCVVASGNPTCEYVPTSTPCMGVNGVCFQGTCGTAAAPTVGQLSISEVMTSPSAGTTKYIELTSTSDEMLNINGLSLSYTGSSTGTVSVDKGAGAAVVLPARGTYVLASNADIATNGGVAADLGYGAALDLGATGQLSLRVNGVPLDNITYDATFPQVPGRSMNLSSVIVGTSASRHAWYWCASSANLPGGDRGSPGLANETCGVSIPASVDFCAIQSPKTFPSAILAESSNPVLGRVRATEVTTRNTAGNDSFPYLVAELGFGETFLEPVDWTWVPATANASYAAAGGAEDEVTAMLQVPIQGSYRYGFRFRFTQGPASAQQWTYCDQNGKVPAGGPANYGEVTVNPAFPVANHVVISEISTHAGSAQQNDFVELYNPTKQDVNLGGLMLQYKAATSGSFGNTFTIPAGKIIRARGYFLIGVNSYSGSVTADATWTGVDLAGGASSGGHVRYGQTLTTTAVVVDTVGWGTANVPEGTAAPRQTDSNGSIERKARSPSTTATMAASGADALRGNGADSDNNASDFVTRVTRQPQNSSSPIEVP